MTAHAVGNAATGIRTIRALAALVSPTDATVIVVTAAALCSAIFSSTSLASLLLLGYAGVTQFFPGVVLGLYSKRVTMQGVFTGLVTGIAIITFLMITKRDPFFGLNAGFIALCVNFLITVAVSWLTGKHSRHSDDQHPFIQRDEMGEENLEPASR